MKKQQSDLPPSIKLSSKESKVYEDGDSKSFKSEIADGESNLNEKH